ncbi:hypothetical protein K2Q16_02860 [Patescibacteria group bacterium]|nr:hypothetical protein [Patescibacteria group bacterium]
MLEPAATSSAEEPNPTTTSPRAITSLPTYSMPRSPNPTSVTSAPSGVQVMAWLYPSAPGCGASAEYRDGRTVDVLKPEFFTINGGSLTRIDNTGCNGYSPAFVAELKRHSKEQYVTISSASAGDMETFLTGALADNTDITTLVSFIVDNGLTGIELDFEDFGGWNANAYANYKTFVTQLGTALRAQNKKLMLAGPAIADSTEQGWFLWRYEDFATLPVDHMVVMAYDYQFDHGVGEPVAPLDWITRVTNWAGARYPKNKLTIGVPSYGYEGTDGSRPLIRTYDQLKATPGFATAPRDARSGERIWKNSGTTYVYQDSESLRLKIAAIKATGVNSISIWHLGGNQWF